MSTCYESLQSVLILDYIKTMLILPIPNAQYVWLLCKEVSAIGNGAVEIIIELSLSVNYLVLSNVNLKQFSNFIQNTSCITSSLLI